MHHQFQTRNREMAGLVRGLARKHPRLTFTWVTLCLDDSSIESYKFLFKYFETIDAFRTA